MTKYYANRSDEVTASEARHSDFIRRVAGACMVLLENDGTLPLLAPGKVALYGNGARATVKGGTGSGEVNSRSAISIEQGLELAGFTVTTKSWLDAQQRLADAEMRVYQADVRRRAQESGTDVFHIMFNEHFIPKALAPFEEGEGELAIYVLARNSGEGSDRCNAPGDYQLTPEEVALMTALG